MLEKPDLQDEKVSACLQDEYGLSVVWIGFLPLGADPVTAVYHAITQAEKSYFVKLRRGFFDETSVTLPKFLSDQGIGPIIAPLPTGTGKLWASLDVFKVILYPFVDGHDGYEINLSDRQWCDLGTALKSIHTMKVPPSLTGQIQRETYTPRWREIVKTFLARVATESFEESLAQKSAAFLKAKRDVILDLIQRAEGHAQTLRARSPEFTLCHSDLHAGNILIEASGAFYIVDWDSPILAPKERDLMSVGAGLFGARRTPQAEETLFYRGYGHTHIDSAALAYYRYERIIQDLAVECRQIFLTKGDGEDREQAFHYLTSNFLPKRTLEIACKSDKTLRNG
jgi:spectinomycin phosphotransferase